MRFSWLTAAVLAIPPLIATPAYACRGNPFEALLRDSDAFFTGTATPDTLYAGPGTVRYRARGDELGRAPEGPIYGQVVRVDRIGGRASGRLPAGVTEVVVVPWGLDPACGPIRWSGSARWVTPGKHAFYVATLRPPEHWADGRPTVDLRNFGGFPYTGTEPIPGLVPDTSVASLLSPEQLFNVYRALPTYAEIQARGPAVLESLRAWARDRPDLASAMPTKLLLGAVRAAVANGIRQAERRRTDHPVLGTWRFTLRMPEGRSRVFFVRTVAYPTSRWRESPYPRPEDPLELRIPPADGWSFQARAAHRLQDLTETHEQAHGYASGYLQALARPGSADEGAMQWLGNIEVGLLRGVLTGDPRFRELLEVGMQRGVERIRKGLAVETPARFTRGADGVLRATQSFPLGGGEVLILEGEQVSREVIRSHE